MNLYLVALAVLAFLSGLALVGFTAVVWDRRRNRALARATAKHRPVGTGTPDA